MNKNKMRQNLEDNIPTVTKKELREALNEYAQADQVSNFTKKVDAGDHLYRLAKALLRNNGFYTYREAVVDSMGEDGPSPKPEDFE